MKPFPDKKYSIIYADPGWKYKDKASHGSRGACFKHRTEKDSVIADIPVVDIAADDCFLFLWVTMPKLLECIPVIEAWGFRYKTCAFTWVKKNRNKDTWFWGMGNWTRANPELCLLGIRGKPKRMSASVHSVVEHKILRPSEKPGIVRDRIVELCGDIPRIELFAREKVEGWDAWGDEI